jgi:hypothetical protein
MNSGLPGGPRPVARVLLLGPGDRLLLLHAEHAEDGHQFWLTPGGGLETHETFEEAARRELREEIGLISSSRRRARITFILNIETTMSSVIDGGACEKSNPPPRNLCLDVWRSLRLLSSVASTPMSRSTVVFSRLPKARPNKRVNPSAGDVRSLRAAAPRSPAAGYAQGWVVES